MDLQIPLLDASNRTQLEQYGVVFVPIPKEIDCAYWADQLSQPTLQIMQFEEDGDPFYRNILDEPDFPWNKLLAPDSFIAKTMKQHFGINDFENEVRLDDAFCIHYNTDQDDSTGARHTDPSDITVNLCLDKSLDTVGSHVKFYGTETLCSAPEEKSPNLPRDFQFAVKQERGYGTMHWGGHPHETLALEAGQRTNIVLTFCYTDQQRCQGLNRTCYF